MDFPDNDRLKQFLESNEIEPENHEEFVSLSSAATKEIERGILFLQREINEIKKARKLNHS